MPEPEPERDDENIVADDALARQLALSDRLRQLFDHVVEEQVPDDFKELLAQLTDGENTKGEIAKGTGANSKAGSDDDEETLR